jgi:quercetin dioxygenase-like cupin family protein
MSELVKSAHIDDIPPLGEAAENEPEWKPVRIHFGIESFGVNAWVARADGGQIIERHSETEESGTQHEELYLVTSGHATFQVGDETVEAPVGTFVFVPDPDVVREAVARTKGTTVLALGAARGEAFSPSDWELKYRR